MERMILKYDNAKIRTLLDSFLSLHLVFQVIETLD